VKNLRARLRAALQAFRGPPAEAFQDPLPADIARIMARATPYTMTSPERIWSLVESVRYVVRAGIPGALAECGVWRGGSALAMVLVLQELGVADRDIFLYDTFEGMTEPTRHDTTRFGEDAPVTWRKGQAAGTQPWGDFFSTTQFNEQGVRELMDSTGYPSSRVHLVRGPVETTLPDRAPATLALLRLDTDWYESTRHELHTLYPRLSPGGVLIIDDYGHWDGCRRAVDEYFGAGAAAPVLLHRIDYTGRVAIKS
jgi:hypothetical protein